MYLMNENNRLLDVRDLGVRFHTRKGSFYAVDGVSFSLLEGETLCVVGESGSGKSVTAMSVLRLLDENGAIENGEILFTFDGQTLDLAKLGEEDLRRLRGNRIAVVFQEPMTALNPVFTVARQLCEPLQLHRNYTKKQALDEAKELLISVRIAEPERILRSYPHQLSGGMRQRVMIAMALACRPKLLIADEPTTALDVSVQAQILRLIKDLQAKQGTAVLLITHDLGVVNAVADRVVVMYGGVVVENGVKADIFKQGRYSHPYTEGLFACLPENQKKGEPIACIQGNVPHPANVPKGCPFSTRCGYCTQECIDKRPPLNEWEDGHRIACFYADVKIRRSKAHAKRIVDCRA